MTDIKAIANRNSIVLKIDTSIFEKKERPIYLWSSVQYTVSSSGQHSDITNLGVCYYTTNSNEVTYIPFDETQFLYSNNNKTCIVYTTSVKVGNLSVKARTVPTFPIFCLLEGLTSGTTYHIGGYYESSDSTKTHLGYSTVTTKPSKDTSEIGLKFNEIQFSKYIDNESKQQNAELMKNDLQEILPTVSNMFNDATDVNYEYTPTITYESSNWFADSEMYFNCNYYTSTDIENLRSSTIHELEHNYFLSYIDGIKSNFSTDSDVIKFMEFATDCEGATWGKIVSHYYPIISSARYDYLDDYLVCMATNIKYLFS